MNKIEFSIFAFFRIFSHFFAFFLIENRAKIREFARIRAKSSDYSQIGQIINFQLIFDMIKVATSIYQSMRIFMLNTNIIFFFEKYEIRTHF